MAQGGADESMAMGSLKAISTLQNTKPSQLMANNPFTMTLSINQDTLQPIPSAPQDYSPSGKTFDPSRDLFLEAFESLNIVDNSESSDHITNPRQLQKIIRSLRIDIRQKDAAQNSDKAKHAKQMEQNSKANAKLRKENQRLQDLLGERGAKKVNKAQDGGTDDAMEMDDYHSSTLSKVAKLLSSRHLSGAQPTDHDASFLNNHIEAKKSTVFDIDAHWYQMGDKVSRLITEIDDLRHDNGKLQSRINQLENTARDAAKAKENAKSKAHERLLREEKATSEALRESMQLRKAAKRQEEVLKSKDRKIERFEKRVEGLERENERLTGIIFDHCPDQIGAAEIHLQSSRLPVHEMETKEEPEGDKRESEEDGEGQMDGDEDDVEEEQGVKGGLKDREMDEDITEAVPVQAHVLAKSLGSGKRGLEDFEDGVGGNHVLAKRFRGDLQEQDQGLSRIS